MWCTPSSVTHASCSSCIRVYVGCDNKHYQRVCNRLAVVARGWWMIWCITCYTAHRDCMYVYYAWQVYIVHLLVWYSHICIFTWFLALFSWVLTVFVWLSKRKHIQLTIVRFSFLAQCTFIYNTLHCIGQYIALHGCPCYVYFIITSTNTKGYTMTYITWTTL